MQSAFILCLAFALTCMASFKHGQPYVKCDGCKGTGKPWYGYTAPTAHCKPCNGFGYVKLVKCAKCKRWEQLVPGTDKCFSCEVIIPAGD